MKPLPTQAELLALLRYDPETGELFWRARPGKTSWNTRYAGTPALNCLNDHGYRHGTIHSRRFRAHRVIVCMMTGEWPEQVDHERGVRTDNRWKHLKPVSSLEQSKNKKLRSDNTSGEPGVGWCKPAGKWQVRISNRYIGLFATLDEAVAARRAAAALDGYHPNHGRR